MLPIKDETSIERKTQKEQKAKKLMTGKYRKGLKLFAIDFQKMRIYEVGIQHRKDFVVGSNKKDSSRTADINPNHQHLWALNLKNAIRKFGLTVPETMNK